MRSSTLILAAISSIAIACGGDDSGTPDGGNLADAGPTADATSDHHTSPLDASTFDAADGSSTDAEVSDTGTVDATATCGTCPSGYTCQTANGLPVCRSTNTSIPLFTNVYVILMENTSLSTLDTAIKNKQAPNLAGWQSSYATASDYHGVSHPSLPNYLALSSGDTQGVGCDCGAAPNNGSCTAILNFCLTCSCNVASTVQNLGDELEAANKTWMDFGEDMGTACNLTDSGNYAVRHNPFLYYDDIQTSASRCKGHVVDFTNFSVSSPAQFNFIAPNLNDDMHNAPIATGDTWLGTHANDILSSSAYKVGGLLVIVWDEDDSSGGTFPPYSDDPIGLWVMSPYAKSGGYLSSTHADHYSLLATIEDGLGVGRLGKSAQAPPLSDFFPAK